MKKVYTLAGLMLLASAGSALAQGTELFLSEYDEGAQPSAGGTAQPCSNAPNSTGSERALEVYNPTTATVSLDQYSIRRYSNGNTNVTEEERLRRTTSDPNVLAPGPNTLDPSSAYVFACGEATLATILAAADQLSAGHAPAAGPNVLTGGGPIFFNGDDAMALVRWTGPVAGQGTPVIIDIFGIIGNRPLPASGTGTGGWTGADANGVVVDSRNQSLKRRETISTGSTTWNTNTNPSLDPSQYNIGDEWEAYSFAFPANQPADPCAQSYADLGSHTYTGPHGTYVVTGLLEEFNNSISFYPNPAHGRVNVSLGKAKVGRLTILNATGKSIVTRPGAAEQVTLDVSSLTPGMYFVRCESADGKMVIYKELVVQ